MSSSGVRSLPLSYPALASSTFQPVTKLIERLDDLQNIAATTIELIRCGTAAITPVAGTLRFGKSKSIPQPRCALVTVLAILGATDILLEYLADDRLTDDPTVRFAEDAVMNLAAQAIKLDFSARAYCVLLNIARKRALPGVLEALALYRRTESIPCFIRALEGDLSRSIAVECLRSFADRAKPFLLSELFRPDPRPPDRESASSLHRRRSCADVLSTVKLNRAEYEALLDLLFENDVELVLNVGAILLFSRDTGHHGAAARRLKAIRSHADWHMKDELDLLIRHLDEKVDNEKS